MNQNASISGKFTQKDILNSKKLNSAQLNSASSNNSAPEAVPNQVIVKLNPGIQSAQISTLQASLGASVLETTNTSGVQLWSIQGDADAAISAHSSNPAIEYIEPNYILRTTAIPDDSNFDRHWGLNNTGQTGGTPDADIDAVEAWDITTGSSDVVVGVIDTGVDYTHPDLVDNMWTNPGEIAGDGIDNDGNGYIDDVHGYDFINNDGDPLDDDGHGTHVAGTIAARGNNGTGATGVNWSAQIMALKFLGPSGGTTFDAIQAIEYATMMKTQYGVNIDVTNNSWGGGGFSRALSDAIEAAGDADQLFVAAAGNSGTNNDVFPSYPASYDLDNIIAVASTDHNDRKSGFSQFGATSVDLGAPGSSIYSTLPNGQYGSLSGTSMASPHVAGVAALLWADDSGLSALEVKDRILSSVDPIAALDGITVTGGRLNAFGALTAPTASSIQGSKWNDLDEDGVWDNNEPGLEGWTIYFDDNNNGELDSGERSVVTDADGNYRFNSVTPGTYTVAEVLQPGWTQTYPSSGTYTLEVEEDEAIENIDFGNVLSSPGSIEGVKWNDLDEDGVRDNNEPGLEGWTIYLDANNNGELDSGEQSTVTDANGEYSFANLLPGPYTVAEVQQAGWFQTYPAVGSGGSVLDESNDTIDTAISSALIPGNSATFSDAGSIGDNSNVSSTSDVDFIELQLGAGDVVTIDIDARVLGSSLDSVLRLFDSNGTEVAVSDDDEAPGESSSLDSYIDFTATVSDTYYVGVSSFNNFSYDPFVEGSSSGGSTGDYEIEIALNGAVPGTHAVQLDAGEVATDIDFGNAEFGLGEIHGINWNDLDEDGIRDANEPGLEGWTIYLDDNNNGEFDSGEQSTVTNANGEYSFTDLAPGTYTIGEVLQPNWQQTYPFNISSGSVVDESNDTIDTAISSALIPGNSATFSDAGSIGDNSNVSSTSDVDFIELQLGAGDVVTIDIDARVLGSSLDSVLRLFDSNGTEVAVSDDDEAPGESSSLDSYIDFTATVSDTYYVGVSSFNNFNYDPFVEGSNSGFSTGDYEIEINLNGGGSGSLVPGAHTVTVDLAETVTDIDFGNYLAGNPIDGTSGNDRLDGTAQFDIIRGYEGDDRLRGKGDKDILFGDEGRDTLAGNNGDDTIFGGTGNDKAYGGNGDDSIVGGTGNDFAHGGSGMDVLTGVDPDSTQPGLGELDRFRGGDNADTFVLGDASGVYYDDGNDGTGGWGDRAHIIDFVVGEDKIQLHGTASDYELKATRNGLHTNIFLNTDGRDERIGFLRQVELSELDLSSDSFIFVG